MKKLIFALLVLTAPMTSFAQMQAGWHVGRGKGVCAAYNYGQFTGSNGKKHKYVPFGRKRVKGRSHSAMLKHAYRRRK